MTSWDEIRTAFQVARLGTVSGAAEVLGVHHATVIRHIDALEAELGAKLFQRHARGYTPTEAGRELLDAAQETEDRFSQLVGRLRGGEGMAGDLVVTSLLALSPHLAPILAEFQDLHPAVVVRYLTAERLFRLEYGEAHVAIRAGQAPPNEPDNVVQPFIRMRTHLVASDAYVARHGMPSGEGDLARHRFVGTDDENGGRAPFNTWISAFAPRERVTYRVGDNASQLDAIVAGAGLGFVWVCESRSRHDLHEVLPPRDEWTVPHWLVTHVDLHRTPKVQAILSLLKERARAWEA
jgi:DNA-binding transcriptional LysR family regulator